MNNSRTYNQYYLERHPGLWILLTDETEESIDRVNDFINTLIQKNFDGKTPKNRCYLHVIGYHGKVTRLVSGYLSDYEKFVIEFLDIEKRVLIDNHVETIRVKRTIWCKKTETHKENVLADALLSIRSFIEAWIENNPYSPAPVIWNIGSIFIEDTSISNEIERAIRGVKSIDSNDGNVLFMNIYPSKSQNIFLPSEIDLVRESSCVPENYLPRIRYEIEELMSIEGDGIYIYQNTLI